MNVRILVIRQILAFLILILIISSSALPADHIPGKLKPFRVLVIIGDQWKDPASYMVEVAKPTGEYSGYDANPGVTGANDFHHLVILLKSWSIPFDVVRLDQQFLDRYMFLDMNNNLVMIMDDPGGAQSSWLEHWHYPILTEDIIEKYLIKPLQEHNAVLNINTVFSQYPNGRFISMNELIGYLHAQNTGNWSSGQDKLTITLGYDPHYCRYFETHSSSWNFEISDWLLKEVGKPAVSIDGKVVSGSEKKIEIPNGTGEHKIEVKF